MFSNELRTKKDKGCRDNICDGSGYIEICKKDDEFESDYTFCKKCLCVVGEVEHKIIMENMKYTQHTKQKSKSVWNNTNRLWIS